MIELLILLALAAPFLMYFVGLSRGHAMACTRIADLAEIHKVQVGEAIRLLRKERGETTVQDKNDG